MSGSKESRGRDASITDLARSGEDGKGDLRREVRHGGGLHGRETYEVTKRWLAIEPVVIKIRSRSIASVRDDYVASLDGGASVTTDGRVLRAERMVLDPVDSIHVARAYSYGRRLPYTCTPWRRSQLGDCRGNDGAARAGDRRGETSKAQDMQQRTSIHPLCGVMRRAYDSLSPMVSRRTPTQATRRPTRPTSPVRA
jgi:hypothetical protein